MADEQASGQVSTSEAPQVDAGQEEKFDAAYVRSLRAEAAKYRKGAAAPVFIPDTCRNKKEPSALPRSSVLGPSSADGCGGSVAPDRRRSKRTPREC